MSAVVFNIGDDVYIGDTMENGRISALYPEINIALIKTDKGLIKAKISDLYKVIYHTDNEAVTKRRGLLDRIRGVFGHD